MDNLEVFYVDYAMPTVDHLSEQQKKLRGSEAIGWYWWFVNEYGTGDDDPRGPYKTYTSAHKGGQKEITA